MKNVIGIAVVLLGLASPFAFGALTPEQSKQAQSLIVQFGEEEFKVREDAVRKLIEMGPDVIPLVEKEKAETQDAEIRTRCDMVLKGLAKKTAPVATDTPATETPGVEAVEKRLDEKILTVMGVAGWPVQFSADGTRICWPKRQGGKSMVMCDETEGTLYDRVGGQMFSDSGTHLVYLAMTDGKWFVVKDGHEGAKYDEVRSPTFSRDEKSLAYWARNGDRECVVVDSAEGKQYQEVSKLLRCVTGKGFVYRAQQGKDAFIVLGTTEQAKHEFVGEPRVSPDGKHLAYRVGQDEQQWQVVDGVEGKKYLECGQATFSPDGKRMAYAALKENEKWCLVLDGVETGAYDKVGFYSDMTPGVFSPDGKSMAFIATKNGQTRVICGDKSGPPVNGLASYPEFSPDGKHLAYAVIDQKSRQTFVVCDNMRSHQSYRNWGGQGPVWSPDGKHLIWVLSNDQPKFRDPVRDWRIVVDGVEGMNHWLVTLIPQLDRTPGSLRFNMVDRQGAHTMEVQWPQDTDWKTGMDPIK